MIDLHGKVALVTGGSRGIGKAIAETLAKSGLQVFLTYVSKPAEAEAVAEGITAAGGKARAFKLDVSDSDAVSAFFQEEIKDKGDRSHKSQLAKSGEEHAVCHCPGIQYNVVTDHGVNHEKYHDDSKDDFLKFVFWHKKSSFKMIK